MAVAPNSFNPSPPYLPVSFAVTDADVTTTFSFDMILNGIGSAATGYADAFGPDFNGFEGQGYGFEGQRYDTVTDIEVTGLQSSPPLGVIVPATMAVTDPIGENGVFVVEFFAKPVAGATDFDDLKLFVPLNAAIADVGQTFDVVTLPDGTHIIGRSVLPDGSTAGYTLFTIDPDGTIFGHGRRAHRERQRAGPLRSCAQRGRHIVGLLQRHFHNRHPL